MMIGPATIGSVTGMPPMNVRITADTSELRVPFSLRGLDGHIDVSLTRNTDPDLLAYSLLSGGEHVDFARDFPVCRGIVTYPADIRLAARRHVWGLGYGPATETYLASIYYDL